MYEYKAKASYHCVYTYHTYMTLGGYFFGLTKDKNKADIIDTPANLTWQSQPK